MQILRVQKAQFIQLHPKQNVQTSFLIILNPIWKWDHQRRNRTINSENRRYNNREYLNRCSSKRNRTCFWYCSFWRNNRNWSTYLRTLTKCFTSYKRKKAFKKKHYWDFFINESWRNWVDFFWRTWRRLKFQLENK